MSQSSENKGFFSNTQNKINEGYSSNPEMQVNQVTKYTERLVGV